MKQLYIDGKPFQGDELVAEAERIEQDGDTLTGYTGDSVTFKLRGVKGDIKVMDGDIVRKPEQSEVSQLKAELDQLKDMIARLEVRR